MTFIEKNGIYSNINYYNVCLKHVSALSLQYDSVGGVCMTWKSADISRVLSVYVPQCRFRKIKQLDTTGRSAVT